MLHVPYKGVSQALTALVSGEITVSFPGIVPALPHVRSGKLRALAVSSARRSSAVPEVPALSEAGVPGYDESNWQGLLAPAGTSSNVIHTLNDDVAAIVRSTHVRNVLAAAGTDPLTSEPAAFERFLAAETAKWRKLVKETGAKVD
jgi:tripartite-type tricarboxylate transporter receptor subunit TctC